MKIKGKTYKFESLGGNIVLSGGKSLANFGVFNHVISSCTENLSVSNDLDEDKSENEVIEDKSDEAPPE